MVCICRSNQFQPTVLPVVVAKVCVVIGSVAQELVTLSDVLRDGVGFWHRASLVIVQGVFKTRKNSIIRAFSLIKIVRCKTSLKGGGRV